MYKINIEEIMNKLENLLSQKISLLITAFKEPNISKAIESAMNQKTRYEYDIIISAPDKDTLDIARKYAKIDKRIKIFQDPGKGKSYALNLLFNKIGTDIFILTDGDVWINDTAITEIANLFLLTIVAILRPIKATSGFFGLSGLPRSANLHKIISPLFQIKTRPYPSIIKST